MPFSKVKENLEKYHFAVQCFEKKEEAAAYLLQKLEGKKVGYGGSTSLVQMGLKEALNSVGRDEKAEYFLLSANALSETGELINIDGTGNRIGSSFFGPENLIYVIGRNKLSPDLPSAIDRARNVAGPLNARDRKKNTPCVEDLKCHDCDSDERICRGMAITARPMKAFKSTEVILINEDLGF